MAATAAEVERLLDRTGTMPAAITTAVINGYIESAVSSVNNTLQRADTAGSVTGMIKQIVLWYAADMVNAEAAVYRSDKKTEELYVTRADRELEKIRTAPGGLADNRPLRTPTMTYDYRSQGEVDSGVPVEDA